MLLALRTDSHGAMFRTPPTSQCWRLGVIRNRLPGSLPWGHGLPPWALADAKDLGWRVSHEAWQWFGGVAGRRRIYHWRHV
jgi:hypothetical protein